MTSPCKEIEELLFQVGKGVLGSLPIINRKGFCRCFSFGFWTLWIAVNIL